MGNMVLKSYSPMAQHTGTWLRGYSWNIYGCGTFSKPVGEVYAVALMKRFMEKLDHKLRAPVSYYAALERRYSGCGMSPIPVHWHFLAACPRSEGMVNLATRIWEDQCGNAKIERYDGTRYGCFYVSKLVNHANGAILDGKFEHLKYNGPTDLLAAAATDPYVPNNLKDKVFGKYLALRDADLCVC